MQELKYPMGTMKFNSGELAALALASAFLSVTLFLFNPLSIYFSDPERLGYLGSSQVLVWGAISAGVTALLFFPVFWLGTRYRVLLVWLAAVVTAYSYIIQPDYGLFRGNGFVGEERIFELARSLRFIELPLVLLVIAPVWFLFKAAPKFFSVFFAFLFLSVGFQLYQSFDMHRHLMETPSADGADRSSLGQTFAFSKIKKNLVLIVPDAGAGYLLDRIFSDGDLAKRYRGFTRYSNAVSIGNYTMPSVAAVIGGESYSPTEINRRADKTIKQNIIDAYHRLFGLMSENGYSSHVVKAKFATCSELKGHESCVNPVDLENALLRNRGIVSTRRLDTETIFHFVAFKVLPVSLKPLIYRSARWESALNTGQAAINVQRSFGEYLLLDSLPEMSVVSENPSEPGQFHFIWNDVLISPFGLREDCTPLDPARDGLYSKSSRLNSTRCVLEALGRWFDWMRANGVYDNTKVLIVSDHGAHDYGSDWFRGAARPIFMVKDFGRRSPMEVSSALVQNSDILAILCGTLRCPGVGPDPRLLAGKERTARFHITTHGNHDFAEKSKVFDIQRIYEIRGTIDDYPEFEVNEKFFQD